MHCDGWYELFNSLRSWRQQMLLHEIGSRTLENTLSALMWLQCLGIPFTEPLGHVSLPERNGGQSLGDQGPISLTVFHSNSNSMEILFNSYHDCLPVIATKFCTRHDSCRDMCKNLLRSDGQQRNHSRAKFPSNFQIAGKTSLVKRAHCLISNSTLYVAHWKLSLYIRTCVFAYGSRMFHKIYMFNCQDNSCSKTCTYHTKVWPIHIHIGLADMRRDNHFESYISQANRQFYKCMRFLCQCIRYIENVKLHCAGHAVKYALIIKKDDQYPYTYVSQFQKFNSR